jgi:hypothetical protein
MEQGKYTLARAKLEDCLNNLDTTDTATAHHHDPDHQITINHVADSFETLVVKRKLARVIEQQGQSEEAIELFREVLSSQENLHGVDHLETLETVDNLAIVLANTSDPGKWAHAEYLARRSLWGRQLALPENDFQM